MRILGAPSAATPIWVQTGARSPMRCELAYRANGSLSRLSNVVKRFEQRGWAQRSPDTDDGRYTLVSLTDSGYAAVVAAAPTHLRTVHRFVLDPLTEEDQHALARIAAKLHAAVDLA